MSTHESEIFTCSFEKCGEDQETRQFLLRIHYEGEETFSGFFELVPPLEAEPAGRKSIALTDMKKGTEMSVPMRFRFRTGGCQNFYGWVRGRKNLCVWTFPVRLGGSGWYSGDTHTHSTYSDGTSTLSENRRSMMEKGHSFLISTDHNTMDQESEIESYRMQDVKNGFLHLASWEFTTPYGHALAYGVHDPEDVSRIRERGNTALWQSFIDDMNGRGGNIYLAHPYEAPKYEYGEGVMEALTGYNGIEVWNGLHHHALSYQNRKAFELWDRLIIDGNRHIYGNAVSDAHTACRQGDPYIKGVLPCLDRDAVLQMLKSGRYFGSNGPEIRFDINGASFGEICRVNKGSLLHISLSVMDPLGELEEVLVIKGQRQDRRPVAAKKKVYRVLDVFPAGEERTLLKREWYLPGDPGDYYRVEAVSAQSTAGWMSENHTEEKGYAYSNPVWIEEQPE